MHGERLGAGHESVLFAPDAGEGFGPPSERRSTRARGHALLNISSSPSYSHANLEMFVQAASGVGDRRGAVRSSRACTSGCWGGPGRRGGGWRRGLAATGHRRDLGSRDRERAAQVVDELRERWGDRVAGLEPGIEPGRRRRRARRARHGLGRRASPTARPTPTSSRARSSSRWPTGSRSGAASSSRCRRLRARSPPRCRRRLRRAYVVAAFQLVPAAALADISAPLTGDVLVVGDDDGRPTVLDLVDSHPRSAGLRRRLARERDRHRDLRRGPAHRQPPAQGRGIAPHRGRRIAPTAA